MDDKIKYSIIYGVIRPEISERLSIGLVIITKSRVSVRYSEKKLKVFESLLSKSEYELMGKIVRSLVRKQTINGGNINYLSRYSNNMITFSPLQTIDLEPSQKNEDWLYRNYVAITRER